MERNLSNSAVETEEVTFEDNVLLEERIKARALSSVRLAQLGRSESPRIASGARSPDDENFHSPSKARSVNGEAASHEFHNATDTVEELREKWQQNMSISMGDIMVTREEVDVREGLFESQDAYPHSVDFQRVVITEVGGVYYRSSSLFYISLLSFSFSLYYEQR